jgi:hypothetical protein
MAQLQLQLKVRTSEGNKQTHPVNTLEKHKDGIGGVDGVKSIKRAIFGGSL